MQVCRFWHQYTGEIDREIVVNHENELIDGYIGYLILKESGFDGDVSVRKSDKRKKKWFRKDTNNWSVEKSYRNMPTTYVFGKHREDGREFMWRIPKNRHDLEDGITVGSHVFVNTKYGNKVITVTRVETFNTCTSTKPVKEVYGIC